MQEHFGFFFFIMITVQWTFFIKARLRRHVFKLHLVIKILNYSVRNVYLSLNKRDLALRFPLLYVFCFRFFALFYLKLASPRSPNCVLNAGSLWVVSSRTPLQQLGFLYWSYVNGIKKGRDHPMLKTKPR